MTRTLTPGRLIAATHNKGKVKELKDLFEPLGFEVVSAAELDLPEPEETEFTFSGNALIKARAAAMATGAPALSDDSGIAVKALGGMPGVNTADWAGHPRDFYKAMEKVENELNAIDAEDRSAKFVCCLAVVWPDGHEEVFEGESHGTLTWPPRGEMGFGFDPVFVPAGRTETFAELQPEEKHAMSHRADAFHKLKAALL
ncbi:RdgB/HAM1 family non-canonical purine NTP pyrophosphatase [Hyphomonas sp. FCG-A18]|uniref:RdgB/HAM1 family non-canonical purine NTP pyrophosphatase n=1 Tax=Hyphomonas sp. FCG-A18 TaxID=3080019 RepID=UPI002B2B1051|nr:RdgB/HAM1 family non-canonical purine NTP pyrophosphatase [Hyphomonas sp. FCG-A18]